MTIKSAKREWAADVEVFVLAALGSGNRWHYLDLCRRVAKDMVVMPNAPLVRRTLLRLKKAKRVDFVPGRSGGWKLRQAQAASAAS